MNELDAKAAMESRVSRETIERLELYVSLLAKWQKTINLIAPSTLPVIWSRHILDSAQLMQHVPSAAQSWLDLGSGGGFPGLVCAAMALESNPNIVFTLVEADVRKATFLRETARQMGLRVGVMSRRIEDLPPSRADVISARALAPLASLCRYAHPHLSETGICLFQKGARHADELATAQQDWHITYSVSPSITEKDAVLVKIERLHHA
jgi:16S rRNA (guanine527-N7)-methyltransferase